MRLWFGSNCLASLATVLSPFKAAGATGDRNFNEQSRERLIETRLGAQRHDLSWDFRTKVIQS
jgi:hypothetical protein